MWRRKSCRASRRGTLGRTWNPRILGRGYLFALTEDDYVEVVKKRADTITGRLSAPADYLKKGVTDSLCVTSIGKQSYIVRSCKVRIERGTRGLCDVVLARAGFLAVRRTTWTRGKESS